ncbi:MAG: hypothetical protein V4731_13965 [Pseudomonadota bacterium]
MTQLLPSDRPDQPVGNAVQLALKDELRTLEFNLQKGAQWLLHDVGDSLVQRVAPKSNSVPARGLRKLQTLVDSTAQAALSTLHSARDAAASTVLDDAAYRQLEFKLEPLSALLALPSGSAASRPFTSAVYWLTRHAIELDPVSAGKQIAREQAIDEVYWRLTREEEDLIARVRAIPKGAADARDHTLLLAGLLLALLAVHPLRDANLPPWAERATPPADTTGMLRILLTVVVTIGLAAKADAAQTALSERLQLSRQMVNARLSAFETALAHPAPQRALADELAFLLRHA